MRAKVAALLEQVVRGGSLGNRQAKAAEVLAMVDPFLPATPRPEPPPDGPPMIRQPLFKMRYACGASATGSVALPEECPIHGEACSPFGNPEPPAPFEP